MKKYLLNSYIIIFILAGFLVPNFAFAAGVNERIDLTTSWVGYASLLIFVVAYAFVMTEELSHLRKSKPVIIAAGIIWVLISIALSSKGMPKAAGVAVRENILEYAELFLFLLVAMTYINAMIERNVFKALHCWLISKKLNYTQLFWVTGLLAFFISPVADNLTTALLMGAVILAVGKDSPKFVSISFINVVVAANAGGAYSPFGDITTLMVWQKGLLSFSEFFALFIPSAVNFLVPAVIMSFFIPKESPADVKEKISMRRGAKTIMVLFLLTIITAVSMQQFLNLPPTLGMMTGLSYLMFFSFYLKKTNEHSFDRILGMDNCGDNIKVEYDILHKIAKAEWDTLFFFFGIVLIVGGLGTIGYLAAVSKVIYIDWGPTNANITVGILSAILDNIPVMFSVITMNPDMSDGQWLLVTLTAGIGGSIFSIGSAAGVALMGQSKGIYTFGSHLKWTPVIVLGYFASIGTHMWLNSSFF